MREKGFTLVELLVVIIIIGILASLAIPRFGKTADRAMETEAKLMLSQIQKLESVYYLEHKTYTKSLEKIGFEQEKLVTNDEKGKARYLLNVLKADENGFTAEAVPQVKDLRVYRITESGSSFVYKN